MWVKICANTCLEDAMLSAELGADAVGFVFAASKRQVTAEQVEPIARLLPSSVERIGVFAGASTEAIVAAVRTAGLTGVQLHGGAGEDAVAVRLRAVLGAGLRIIRTVHWPVDAEDGEAAERVASHRLEELAESPVRGPALLDAQRSGVSGGLGILFDWKRAARSIAGAPGLQVVAAGGLTPANVVQAIRTMRPWGVDVASGVEREPGRKDPAKLRAFLENARAAT